MRGAGNDIAPVVAVMRKLRHDHRSTSSNPGKPPQAYDEAASCLTHLARDERPTVCAKGFRGMKKHHYFCPAPGGKPTKAAVKQIVRAQDSLAYPTPNEFEQRYCPTEAVEAVPQD
jgi:hypothetical protein